MESYERLLLENKAWVQEQLAEDPEYFRRLSANHDPDFLWIGSSDSRVSPYAITNAEPGSLFVHKNLANVVLESDLNTMSTLDFAVNILDIKHIIVCGNYGCSSIRVAIHEQDKLHHSVNNWLQSIRDIYELHRDELETIADESQRLDRLVEYNVKEQVANLAKTGIIQESWKKREKPALHGWVYRLTNGVLKSLCTAHPHSEVEDLPNFDSSEIN